jgi:electron transport complex protein RnfD
MSESLANNMTVSEIMTTLPSNLDLFLGKMLGSAGEVAAFALLLGLIYMLWKKIITWHIPVSILLTVFVFAGILNFGSPEKFPTPLFHLLTGGLMLGAIFMATDYVTSPMTAKGMLIYGFGIGIITILIRTFGAYPEGVQFAILLMNGFTPLINKYVKPKRFGEVKNG